MIRKISWLSGALVLISALALWLKPHSVSQDSVAARIRRPALVSRAKGITPALQESASPLSEPPRDSGHDLPNAEEMHSLVGRRLEVDPFENDPVVSFEETKRNAAGEFTRSRVVQTSKKYSLILVIENYGRDPNSGKDVIKQRQSMVANHLIVKLNEKYSESDLHDLARKNGATVQSKISKNNYIVGFEALDVGALDQMIARFKLSPVVSSPEPNYVVGN